jgi:hypothetical protein
MKPAISRVVASSLLFAVWIGVVPAFAQEKKTAWLANPSEIASGVESLPVQGSATKKIRWIDSFTFQVFVGITARWGRRPVRR